jgi:hypothetical protein
MSEKPPIFFIYKFGFREISLPPFEQGDIYQGTFLDNYGIIKITTCDDGVLITTEEPMEQAVDKLNRFIGRKVINIHCDDNKIIEDGYFKGANITKGNHREKVIFLDWWD